MIEIISSRALVAAGFVLCALGACGSEPDSSPSQEFFKSGTRLRLHGYEAVSGARDVLGFFDSELGEACSFRRTGEGRYHCLPGVFKLASFSDAQCSQPTAVIKPDVGCGEPEPRYALSYSPPPGWCGQDGTWAVYELGAAIAGNTSYHLDPDGSCLPTDRTGSVLYALTALDPGLFVEASEDRVEVEGGLGARVWAGRDGSRQVFGLFDAATGLACDPSAMHPDSTPADKGSPALCAPIGSAHAPEYFYEDAACSQSVAYQRAGCPAPPAVFRTPSSPQACAESAELYAVGDPVDADLVRSGEACAPGDNSGLEFFKVGERTTSDYPFAVRQPTGEGRLLRYEAGSPAGSSLGLPLPAGAFFDQELGSWCQPWPGADGNPYCISMRAIAGGTHYSDAACSIELVEVLDADTCDLPLPRYGARITPSPAGCAVDPAEDGFEIGAHVSVPAIYRKQASGCTGPTTPAANRKFYLVGASRGLSVFAQLTEFTE